MSEQAPDPEAQRIGQTIKALREAYGWKVTQFATAAHMSHSYLSNIEAGRKRASHAAYRRIAQVLGVPLGAILSPAWQDEHAPPADTGDRPAA